ncbi:MAG: two-component system response regulator [Candidatus Infernicultor aquiphilus]|uniref:Two-component system response regulator n=1 Tax=Candidatus Infernicultor aquiphilus TaxID=1805029 RepID=A0A2M7K739_9BACT|nr:sigma-54-dependent Fis family transcriptional regulator [bacterium]PIU24969.1 MAG: two-component system response regulator [Candidatus Atribacteria bacterium CG08_land_8_20_14_0_20_33_29]PIW12231.1 MAG: two-component system response regulator [Candidatus Atribacteria bacterium CG17_big_fil_post_rev_8_21_14_2_50_34_11]PIX33933.1 MAG: two-component system response regulator [Candidatus Atribacteria bacterium CG_4_8_14_3_um_filter_34_18]PIY31234.1 MAG: two-component system response regulator [C
MQKILVVDDEQNIRRMLNRVLSSEGFIVKEAINGLEALKRLEEEDYSLVLLDLKMPGLNGIETLKKIREFDINLPIIMISAYGSISEAVEAMKLGALDYLIKPFDIEELKIIVERAIKQYELRVENIYYREEEEKRFNFDEIIGKSKAIKRVLEMVKSVSVTPATVLITGESGTGKELIARAIHKNSPGNKNPFVVVNCVAFSSYLLESELFGHEKGAFTGAISKRIGRFEMAKGGTIFLDEIGEIDPVIQTKLLRFLQEKEFERVGSSKSIKVDVRILSATNLDLKKKAEDNNFRQDLYYRLNVFNIEVPSLRERKEDIPLLVEHFIHKYDKILNKKVEEISPQAMELLLNYDYPGNIRELENILERSMIMAKNNIMDETYFAFINKENFSEKKGTLKEVEKELIIKYLIQKKSNRTKTAELLGISRRNLQNKIKEYQINL